MKLKALASLCTEAKTVQLFNAEDGTQWAGTGYAVWRLPENLGKLTQEALCAIFDIPQEKQVEVNEGKSIELNFELEDDAILLNDVVITSNKNETSRREAPVTVAVITPKIFQNTNSVCLAEGLSFLPGLRLESNCQNCGFQQVRINGLEGAYSQILIDGRAVSSALSQVYGIEQIPVNMIEKDISL